MSGRSSQPLSAFLTFDNAHRCRLWVIARYQLIKFISISVIPQVGPQRQDAFSKPPGKPLSRSPRIWSRRNILKALPQPRIRATSLVTCNHVSCIASRSDAASVFASSHISCQMMAPPGAHVAHDVPDVACGSTTCGP